MGETTPLPMANNKCCSEGVKTVIYACSGNSNVGQIANSLMLRMSRKGYGGGSCLAGVGAGLSGFVETAKSAHTIVIDGCPVKCGWKIFEKYGAEPSQHFVLTDLGFEKTSSFERVEEETGEALNRILPDLQARRDI